MAEFNYNIIFSKGRDVDFFGTNVQITETLKEYINDPENQILTYRLNDLPLTLKFINQWIEYRKIRYAIEGKSTRIQYHYNYYLPKDNEAMIKAKQQMNIVIDCINSFGEYIPIDLHLNCQSTDYEYEKLNNLHFNFERATVNIDRKKDYELFYLYEKINQLVHYIEKPYNNFHRETIKASQMVIRPCSGIKFPHGYVRLIDDDYKNFQQPSAGDLILDFSTVGKDLWHAASTNDIELVKNQEVKPQEYLTDYVQLQFGVDSVVPDNNFVEFYRWCDENAVAQYLDLQQPKYKPGRHILGHLKTDILVNPTSLEFKQKILDKTPKLIGSYISDSNGDPILSEYL